MNNFPNGGFQNFTPPAFGFSQPNAGIVPGQSIQQQPQIVMSGGQQSTTFTQPIGFQQQSSPFNFGSFGIQQQQPQPQPQQQSFITNGQQPYNNSNFNGIQQQSTPFNLTSNSIQQPYHQSTPFNISSNGIQYSQQQPMNSNIRSFEVQPQVQNFSHGGGIYPCVNDSNGHCLPNYLPTSPNPIGSTYYQPHTIYIPVPKSESNSVSVPSVGSSSPLAIAHLKSMGFEYEPITTESTKFKNSTLSHPSILFQPTKDPLKCLIDSGKLVLVDVEALSKILKLNKSTEFVPKILSPFEQYKALSLDYEKELYQRTPATGRFLSISSNKNYWDNSEHYEENKNGVPHRCVDYIEELDKQSPSRCLCNRPFSIYDEPSRFGQNRRSLLDYGSMFHNHRPCKVQEEEKVIGPPRRNDWSGSTTDLIRDYDSISRDNLVGNLSIRLGRCSSYGASSQTPPNNQFRFNGNEERNLYYQARMRRLFAKTLARHSNPYLNNMRNDSGSSILDIIGSPNREILQEKKSESDLLKLEQILNSSNESNTFMFNSGVILTKRDYYCKPCVEDLDKLFVTSGACTIENFEIGHVQWGKITFTQKFDVTGLNLDNIVEFGHKAVRIYSKDTKHPPIGSGLNRPAIVVLYKMYPTNAITKRTITDPVKLRHLNYEGRLRENTAAAGATFIGYEPQTGEWSFKVPYFVKDTIVPFTN